MSIFGKNEEVRQGATGNWYTMAIIDGLIPIKPNIKIKARAYLSANQLNLVNNVFTKILLDTESYDIGNNFANYKFTAPVDGYYPVAGQVFFTSVVADKSYTSSLYKNGSAIIYSTAHSSLATSVSVAFTDIISLVAGDYLELYARSAAGVDTVDVVGDSQYTYLAVHLLSV